MKATQATQIKVKLFIGVVVLVFFSSILALVFWPPMFEVHDLSGKPEVRCDGMRVARYGYSRIHSRTYVNYIDGDGDKTDGRCYVDVLRDGRAVRRFGWSLTRRVSEDRKTRTFAIQ